MRYALLLIIGTVWGSQYVLNDILLTSFTPLGLTAIRMFFGFITLSFIILIMPSQRKIKLHLTPKLFTLLLILGAAEAAIPFTLIAYGQTQVSSSVSAIILGIIPMITIVLHTYFLKTHTITRAQIIGMCMALIGLVILINPTSESLEGTALGYIALFLGAISFAVSFILMDKVPHTISALHISRFILFIYSTFFMIVWFFTNEKSVPTEILPWAYIVFLGIFASGLVYVLYIYLVRLAGPTFTSFSNYIVPLVGTFLGVLILNEPFGLNISIALPLIILSLFIVNM